MKRVKDQDYDAVQPIQISQGEAKAFAKLGMMLMQVFEDNGFVSRPFFLTAQSTYSIRPSGFHL
jgi:cell envelope opacity-associated protein A